MHQRLHVKTFKEGIEEREGYGKSNLTLGTQSLIINIKIKIDLYICYRRDLMKRSFKPLV